MYFRKAFGVLTFLMLVFSPVALAKQEKRLVFFDVFVSDELIKLKPSASLFSRVLANEIVNLEGIQVMDQGTRDTLLLQRKFNLADCAKSECRFAMAKALPGVEFMLEAEVESIGSMCAFTMRVKSVRRGSIIDSEFQEASCEPKQVLFAIRKAAANISVTTGDERPTDSAKAQKASSADDLVDGKATEMASIHADAVLGKLDDGLVLSTRTGSWLVTVKSERKKYRCTVSRDQICVISGLTGKIDVIVSGQESGSRSYILEPGPSVIALAPRESAYKIGMGTLGGVAGLSSLLIAGVAFAEASEGFETGNYIGGVFLALGIGMGVYGGVLLVDGVDGYNEPPLNAQTGANFASTPPVREEALSLTRHEGPALAPVVGYYRDNAVGGFRLTF